LEERQSPAPVRRGKYARQRILRAALEVLAEAGLLGFNMEAIASKAGASKATLYRRWASPSALLIDAMDAQFQPLPHVSTGNLRNDLVTLAEQFTAVLNDSPFPKLMAAFIDAAERDPELAGMHEEITRRRRQPVLDLLADARRRQEIDPELDLELVVDLLAGPFFYRRFVAHHPIPANMAAAVVDQVLASFTTGASSEWSSSD
jgi:AcrR family transcriptional regulator